MSGTRGSHSFAHFVSTSKNSLSSFLHPRSRLVQRRFLDLARVHRDKLWQCTAVPFKQIAAILPAPGLFVAFASFDQNADHLDDGQDERRGFAKVAAMAKSLYSQAMSAWRAASRLPVASTGGPRDSAISPLPGPGCVQGREAATCMAWPWSRP